MGSFMNGVAHSLDHLSCMVSIPQDSKYIDISSPDRTDMDYVLVLMWKYIIDTLSNNLTGNIEVGKLI